VIASACSEKFVPIKKSKRFAISAPPRISISLKSESPTAAFALGALLSLPAAFAQLNSDQKIDNADAAAMKQLAQTSLTEIESGKLAAAKAQMAAWFQSVATLALSTPNNVTGLPDYRAANEAMTKYGIYSGISDRVEPGVDEAGKREPVKIQVVLAEDTTVNKGP